MKKRFLFSCLASMVFLIPALGFAESKEDTKFTCGVIVPLSGPGAEWGILIRNSMEMAREDLKATDLTFVYEDDQYTPKNTVSAFQKLTSLQHVDCLVTLGSSTSLAVQDLAEHAAIPLFAIALNPKAGQGKAFVFRYYVPISRQMEAISKEISQRNYKRIAVVTSTHDATLGLREALLNPNTLVPVASEEVPVGELDLASIAMKTLASHPDAVFLNLVPPQPSTLAKKLRDLGYRGDFFGGPLLESKEEVAIANGTLDGAWFVTADNANAKDFNTRYEKRFSSSPGILSVYAYDIATIIARGHREKDLRDYIHSLRSFDGLAGHYGWDGSGFDIPAGVWVVHGQNFERAPR